MVIRRMTVIVLSQMMEQKKHMKALRSEVLELDVHRWADDFLSALEHG